MEPYDELPDVTARIRQASNVAGSAAEFCAIAPGLEQIFAGLQSILDNTLSDAKSKAIVDGVFSVVLLSLKTAEQFNGCSS
jgi:hypothetical protein